MLFPALHMLVLLGRSAWLAPLNMQKLCYSGRKLEIASSGGSLLRIRFHCFCCLKKNLFVVTVIRRYMYACTCLHTCLHVCVQHICMKRRNCVVCHPSMLLLFLLNPHGHVEKHEQSLGSSQGSVRACVCEAV